MRGGRIPPVADNADWRRAVAVAKVAMKNAWDGAAEKALFFNTSRPGGAKVKVSWAKFGPLLPHELPWFMKRLPSAS